MSFTQGLELKSAQSLIMSYRLQQSLKILQMTNLELCEFVSQEIEKNPFLKENEDIPSYYICGSQKKYNEEGMDNSIENTIKANFTIHDYLEQQLRLAFNDELSINVGYAFIYSIDDHGFLDQNIIEEISNKCEITTDFAESILSTIQQFDPPGIFSRSLKESFKTQLNHAGCLDSISEMIIDNLDLVIHGNLIKKVQKKYDMREISSRIKLIQSLTPYPSSCFSDDSPIITKISDILTTKLNDEEWLVELNTETLPNVLVDREYYSIVSSSVKNKHDKEFMQNNLEHASWLIRTINQRAVTMLRVAKEIVFQQTDFLERGLRYLKPLTMKTIAMELSLHESTISRVISNKFMDTPHGVFELKYFFSSSLQSLKNSSVMFSSEAVRYRIKEIIDNEPEHLPYSDDGILDILQAEGISIARRTVAKYRESLNIPVFSERKKQKSLFVCEK